MNTKTVYLIKGSTGEYDDYHEWIAKAFFSYDKAYDLLCKLNTIADKTHAKNFDREDYESRFSSQEKLTEELQVLDPSAHVDYTGTSYKIEELEVEEE